MSEEELQVARELVASERRGQFWNKVSGAVLTITGVLMSLIGLWVKGAIDDVIRQQQALSAQWNAYIVAQEGRIARIEERQIQVLKTLADVNGELKQHEKAAAHRAER